MQSWTVSGYEGTKHHSRQTVVSLGASNIPASPIIGILISVRKDSFFLGTSVHTLPGVKGDGSIDDPGRQPIGP